MKEVLFVCQANVGRSQMAEGFYNHFTKSNSSCSAGVDNVSEKYGGIPTPKIQQIMREKGVDLSSHRIKQITPELLDTVKSIVVFCEESICPTYLLGHSMTTFIPVQDPYMMEIEGMRNIRDEIEQVVLKLISQK